MYLSETMSGTTKLIAWMLAAGACVLALFVPFGYHIIWCIRAAAESGSAMALLIVGVVIPPVGWLHGVALWLGYTWI